MSNGTRVTRKRQLLAILGNGTPVFAIRGSDGGYHAEGDLLGQLADGTDLNTDLVGIPGDSCDFQRASADPRELPDVPGRQHDRERSAGGIVRFR